MLSLLVVVGLARAEEAPERLKGFHFGLGGGVGWYSYNLLGADGDLESVSGASTVVSARLRLSEVVALEPTLRASHEAAESWEAFSTEPSRVGAAREDGYGIGLGARVRLAAADRADLAGIVKAGHSRAWLDDEDHGDRSTAFGHTTSAGVGVGIEYWVARRVSVGADFETTLLSWSVSRSEPSEKEYTRLWFGFQPGGDMKVHLYF